MLNEVLLGERLLNSLLYILLSLSKVCYPKGKKMKIEEINDPKEK
jgi:hypothetical protein